MSDADPMATLQVAAWRAVHSAALGIQAVRLDPAVLATSWRAAIDDPPSPAHRVLVAVEADTVVGFAALAPQPPGAAEVVALEVDPRRTRAGHGSRLLAACAELAREDGAGSLAIWVLEDDGARAGFLTAAGLAPDGASRHLDVGGRPVREDRYSAAL